MPGGCGTGRLQGGPGGCGTGRLSAAAPEGLCPAPARTEMDDERVRGHCGRGRRARGGWCEQVNLHVCIGLGNVFRSEPAIETAGRTVWAASGGWAAIISNCDTRN